MTLGFTDGAYNRASGTRDAFGALSDDLVAEGLPPMVSGSGDRERAVQERIWNERMTLTPGTRKTYGYRWWQGKKWWQIHPDTVAPPGTGNHEARRSNDLKWPYNSNTAAHRRAQELAKRHNITCDGMGFREWWHWTFWGPLGTIGTPALAGAATTPPQEEDEMQLYRWNGTHVFGIGRESVYHVPDPPTLGRLQKTHGAFKELDNDGLTAELNFAGVHWDAVDAVLRGAGTGSGGKYWSRLMAEGIAIRGVQATQSKTLDDVLRTAKGIESATA